MGGFFMPIKNRPCERRAGSDDFPNGSFACNAGERVFRSRTFSASYPKRGYNPDVAPTNLIEAMLPDLRNAYWKATAATIYDEKYQAQYWADFRFQLQRTLQAIDIVAAERVRVRALGGEHLGAMGKSLEPIPHMLPWVEPHVEITGPRIAERAKFVADLERKFYTSGREKLASQGPKMVPASRLAQSYRMSQTAVAADAEQVILADTVVGSHFPAAMYIARGDKRVRPTHEAMNRTMMARNWEGYAKCIPPAGFGCRCTIHLKTWRELITVGLATQDFKLKFKIRWGTDEARRNFERGDFPDKGFQGPTLAATVITAPMHGILHSV